MDGTEKMQKKAEKVTVDMSQASIKSKKAKIKIKEDDDIDADHPYHSIALFFVVCVSLMSKRYGGSWFALSTFFLRHRLFFRISGVKSVTLSDFRCCK
ncbi:hypothetical protein J6590_076096 [Homalodisca vitripennis]|nr:hypothetical protein J6590_076096 [Homalodisca vitripennis]